MKEIERLRMDMEEEEDELKLGEGGQEYDGMTEVDINDPHRPSPPTEVPADKESLSSCDVLQELPRSAKTRETLDLEEDAASHEPEVLQHKRTKPGTNTLNPPNLPTKTQKKLKSRPLPDMGSNARDGSPDIDVDTSAMAGPSAPQVELSKREKRRLREAKKACENQAGSKHVRLDLCPSFYFSNVIGWFRSDV
jgi:DnaJ family protein A protein 5